MSGVILLHVRCTVLLFYSRSLVCVRVNLRPVQSMLHMSARLGTDERHSPNAYDTPFGQKTIHVQNPSRVLLKHSTVVLTGDCCCLRRFYDPTVADY